MLHPAIGEDAFSYDDSFAINHCYFSTSSARFPLSVVYYATERLKHSITIVETISELSRVTTFVSINSMPYAILYSLFEEALISLAIFPDSYSESFVFLCQRIP